MQEPLIFILEVQLFLSVPSSFRLSLRMKCADKGILIQMTQSFFTRKCHSFHRERKEILSYD